MSTVTNPRCLAVIFQFRQFLDLSSCQFFLTLPDSMCSGSSVFTAQIVSTGQAEGGFPVVQGQKRPISPSETIN